MKQDTMRGYDPFVCFVCLSLVFFSVRYFVQSYTRMRFRNEVNAKEKEKKSIRKFFYKQIKTDNLDPILASLRQYTHINATLRQSLFQAQKRNLNRTCFNDDLCSANRLSLGSNHHAMQRNPHLFLFILQCSALFCRGGKERSKSIYRSFRLTYANSSLSFFFIYSTAIVWVGEK